MLKRFSNITLFVLCGLLVVGIIVTRNLDTAIETNENRKDEARKAILEFEVDCAAPLHNLVAVDTSTWVRVEYTLPSFSSYNLDKRNGSWFMDDMQTNLEATQKYFGKILNAQTHCTVAHNRPEVLKMSDYVLKIITTNSDTLVYKTFVIDTNYLVQDPSGQLYSGNNDSLFWQLYFGKFRFIPELANQ